MQVHLVAPVDGLFEPRFQHVWLLSPSSIHMKCTCLCLAHNVRQTWTHRLITNGNSPFKRDMAAPETSIDTYLDAQEDPPAEEPTKVTFEPYSDPLDGLGVSLISECLGLYQMH